MSLGILIILLALINILPEFLASFYGSLISLMNGFVDWISAQENLLFKNISFSIENVIISYFLIAFLIYAFKKKTYESIRALLFVIILIQGIFITKKHLSKPSKFIVFHKSRYSMIGLQQQRGLKLYHNLTDSIFKNDHIITNYLVGENLKSTQTIDSISSIYQFGNKTILVINSLGIYNINTFRPDIILLRNSPKINLERVIDSLNPELIISDGSNYKTYRNRWTKTCSIKKRPYYETSKEGAWIYKF